MKRKTAKEILAESFREIAEKKTADRITVKDIAENCGYSTTTFYRHFKDKYDLMAWEYSLQIEGIMKAYADRQADWNETLLRTALLLLERREYLRNLLLHTNGYDSFVQNMKRIHYEGFTGFLKHAMGTAQLDRKTEMYACIYCCGSIDLSCEWILGRYSTSPEELAEVFENCSPFPLRKYLEKSAAKEK